MRLHHESHEMRANGKGGVGRGGAVHWSLATGNAVSAIPSLAIALKPPLGNFGWFFCDGTFASKLPVAIITPTADFKSTNSYRRAYFP